MDGQREKSEEEECLVLILIDWACAALLYNPCGKCLGRHNFHCFFQGVLRGLGIGFNVNLKDVCVSVCV